MTDKLSDRLWGILNESANTLTTAQLCAIDEARGLAKRVEDAHPHGAWRMALDPVRDAVRAPIPGAPCGRRRA